MSHRGPLLVKKLRSDFELVHDGLLRHWNKHTDRCDDIRVFTSRIISGELFARNPMMTSFLFHPSDMFHFGRKEDLVRLWQIPQAPLEETILWRDRIRYKPWLRPEGLWLRYVPAQHLWLSALQKAGLNYQLRHCSEVPRSMIVPSELSIMNNFEILDERSLGVAVASSVVRSSADATYSRRAWLKLYEIYCKRRDKHEIAMRARVIGKRSKVRKLRWVFEQLV